jgi:redox-sensitive bicupin YhaK (pirin superfamily)
VLADLHLAPGSRDLVDATHPERALLVVEGDVEFDGVTVGRHSMAVLSAGPCTLGSSTGARVMLLGGEPVGPRTIWWNFVASDPSAIDDARERWNRQDFPRVPDDHDPWVPAPPR